MKDNKKSQYTSKSKKRSNRPKEEEKELNYQLLLNKGYTISEIEELEN